MALLRKAIQSALYLHQQLLPSRRAGWHPLPVSAIRQVHNYHCSCHPAPLQPSEQLHPGTALILGAYSWFKVPGAAAAAPAKAPDLCWMRAPTRGQRPHHSLSPAATLAPLCRPTNITTCRYRPLPILSRRSGPFPPPYPAVATMADTPAASGHTVRDTVLLKPEEKELFDTLLAAVAHAGTGTVLRCAGGWVRDKLLGRESDDIDIALDNMLGKVRGWREGEQGDVPQHCAVPPITRRVRCFLSRLSAPPLPPFSLPPPPPCCRAAGVC
jgi:hypothetical protein